MKLRDKILLFALPLTLVPFVLTAFAVYYFVIRAYRIQADEEQNKLLAEAIVNIRKEQEAVRRDINLIADLPAVVEYLEAVQQNPDPSSADLKTKEEEARIVLQLFSDQNAYYLQLSLADAQGQERIKIDKLPGGRELGSIKGEEYFRRSLITAEAQSPVEQVRPARFATILTRRVQRERFSGMVVLLLNTEIFQRSMRPLIASRGLNTFLFDDRGLIFAKSLSGVDAEQCIRQINPSAEATALLALPSFEVSQREISSGADAYLFSILPAEAFIRSKYEARSGENWFLGSLRPKESIFERTLGFQIIFFTALIASVIAAVKTANHYSRRVTDPLEQVAEATAKVAQGEFDIRLNISTGDEVEDLAAAVSRMSDDLKKYRAEIIRSAKLAAIGEMASEISHEIQNRISGVSLWVQYLDAEFDKDDPKREYLEEMKQGLQGFIHLLQDLKQFYKTPILELSDANLNDLIKTSLQHIEQQTKERRIETALLLASDLPAIKCDGEKIKSVILNLLLNAVEAVEDGGRVEIETRAENQTEGHVVVFSVKDDGCGIAGEDLSRVFYPFYSTKGSGSGLGLAIASNIVSSHGGKIEVESGPDLGTKFTIVFK